MFNLNDKANGIVTSLNKDLDKLNKKSADAMSTFRQTVDDMSKVNEQIDERINLADTHMKSLETLKQNLEVKKTDNERVISKILDFLN
jgi:hypothetical protein